MVTSYPIFSCFQEISSLDIHTNTLYSSPQRKDFQEGLLQSTMLLSLDNQLRCLRLSNIFFIL